ncbi:Rv3654c family TadE-like protein [Curtobacterium sp. RRHDQ10]|uniref:Rv3654c family TadE-like protein n=1 Tax=Curtobacterium phyllosphaerae TaxID=3413379 RepID=UPI003BF03685
MAGGPCDRGSASVVVLGVALAMIVGTGALVTAGRSRADLARAASAADAAALAAAAATVGLRPGRPCVSASEVALANGAQLARCVVDDASVVVSVTVRSGVFGVDAASRAGPARDSTDRWGERLSVHGLGRSASGHHVYGVPVGQRLIDSSPTPDRSARLRRSVVCIIDQGVTCQARRSS